MNYPTRIVTAVLLLMLISVNGWADESPRLKADHPDVYVVQKGDSLWKIAEQFFENPSDWGQLWVGNEQIKDPNLIFPGDEVYIRNVNNQPQLALKPAAVVKLSPKVRVSEIEDDASFIPLDKIRPFLTHTRIMSKEQLEDSAYVMSFLGDRLAGGQGDTLYVRGLENPKHQPYTIYRSNDELKHPQTKELVGLEVIPVGKAKVTRGGDPVTMKVISSKHHVQVGDRILLADDVETEVDFKPHYTDKPVNQQIIHVVNGVEQIGQYNVVLLDGGEQEGLERGDVLGVYRRGEKVPDLIAMEQTDDGKERTKKLKDKKLVQLPDEKVGELMVFKLFDNTSFALVLRAEKAIHILDKVKS